MNTRRPTKKYKVFLLSLLLGGTGISATVVYFRAMQARIVRTYAFKRALKNGDFDLALSLQKKGIEATSFQRVKAKDTLWRKVLSHLVHVPNFDDGTSPMELILAHLEEQSTYDDGNGQWMKTTRELAKGLIDGGADPNVTVPDTHTTLLMIACEHDDIDLTNSLLKNGADPTAVDDSKVYVISYCHKGDVLLSLLIHGANPNVVGPESMTPLIDRVMNSDLPSVQLLLDKGADVNYRDDNGETALSWAAQTDHSEAITEILLKHHANPNAQNSWGESALMACSQPAVISLLLQYGANIDAADDGGRTALMTAAQYNLQAAARTLAEHHARTDIKDDDGHTALDIASANERTAIIKLLNEPTLRSTGTKK